MGYQLTLVAPFLFLWPKVAVPGYVAYSIDMIVRQQQRRWLIEILRQYGPTRRERREALRQIGHFLRRPIHRVIAEECPNIVDQKPCLSRARIDIDGSYATFGSPEQLGLRLIGPYAPQLITLMICGVVV